MARFVELLLDELGVERITLAGHGWGAAVAVLLAPRAERLVLIDPAPPERWHRLARLWRTPLIGELAMGSINRFLLARILRAASASPAAWPDGRVRAVWEQFDQGTQRATLRLHRWADPARSQELTAGLPDVPTLVMWGADDPWFPPQQTWAGSPVELVDGGGHWPWLDRPEAVERISDFLTAT
jgi:pimeloyl-ACP methyl ester carboxylesterase